VPAYKAGTHTKVTPSRVRGGLIPVSNTNVKYIFATGYFLDTLMGFTIIF
jgi:hypothetical protein